MPTERFSLGPFVFTCTSCCARCRASDRILELVSKRKIDPLAFEATRILDGKTETPG